MINDKQSARRERIRKLCQVKNIQIRPYGNAHWVVGPGVSLIVCDLAFLAERDLEPTEAMER